MPPVQSFTYGSILKTMSTQCNVNGVTAKGDVLLRFGTFMWFDHGVVQYVLCSMCSGTHVWFDRDNARVSQRRRFSHSPKCSTVSDSKMPKRIRVNNGVGK